MGSALNRSKNPGFCSLESGLSKASNGGRPKGRRRIPSSLMGVTMPKESCRLWKYFSVGVLVFGAVLGAPNHRPKLEVRRVVEESDESVAVTELLRDPKRRPLRLPRIGLPATKDKKRLIGVKTLQK